MLAIPEPFEYKLPSQVGESKLNRLKHVGDGEVLKGIVKGQGASDIEERFARALHKNKRVVGFRFQVSFLAGRNLPGEKRLDFLVDTGQIFPVEVDGYFAHKSAAQKARDAVKEILLNDLFRRIGFMPLLRVRGYELASQEEADRKVRELF